eukprot:TRINITY_DN753_c0_g1_i1.p5 TRINITY_DN753_c0_g1~~TRINITY_DN753_c0_g1_i1.p5  ORF type:complete len:161 (-),score=22.80 TRINITY_DN753_c0_g1_i1:820-1302(-)
MDHQDGKFRTIEAGKAYFENLAFETMNGAIDGDNLKMQPIEETKQMTFTGIFDEDAGLTTTVTCRRVMQHICLRFEETPSVQTAASGDMSTLSTSVKIPEAYWPPVSVCFTIAMTIGGAPLPAMVVVSEDGGVSITTSSGFFPFNTQVGFRDTQGQYPAY